MKNKIRPAILLLPSRLILFFIFQMIIALILKSPGDSAKYWLAVATVTNIISISILVFLFRSEGNSFLVLFHFDKANFRKDIILFTGLALLSLPLVFFPNYFLSKWIWTDADIPAGMMFKPLAPVLIYVLLIAFPISIAFAELATYFGYIMPRLRVHFRSKFLVVLLPVIFLSLQHCTLPFIPDINFIMYRALVFLPFATLIGVSLFFRPSLFIYFAILHGLLDFGTVIMLLV